ncbi:MAG: hypothetical protein P4M09_01165 [Devosia sp.]|nr:hypothetical protein [Devosia sp.]
MKAQQSTPMVRQVVQGRRDWGPYAIALLGVLACGLWLSARWHWLGFAPPLNPDEAQFTAGATQLWSSWPFIWAHVDLNTSGPLNAVPLMWPLLLGFTPTIESTRLTGFVLELASIVIFIYVGWSTSKSKYAVLATLPLIIFSTLTANNDFLHYSSEKLSIFIVNLTVLMTVFWLRRHGIVILLLIGILIGALPFCKLQSLPLAAVLAVLVGFVVIIASRAGSRRTLIYRLGAFAIGGIIPAVLLILPLFLIHEQDSFIKGYIGLGSSYTAGHSVTDWTFILAVLDPYASLWLIPTLVVSLALGAAPLFRRANWPAAATYTPLLAAGILSLTAFLTILIPGRAFPHYASYWAWLGNWCGLAIFARLGGDSKWRQAARVSVSALAAVAAAIILFAALPGWQSSLVTSNGWIRRGAGPQMLHRRPLLLDWLGLDTQRIAVWGWASDIYNLAGANSVGRETQTSFLWPQYSASAYYRARMLSDAARTPNFDVMVDAVASGEFAMSDASADALPVLFPELLHFDADPFVLLSGNWQKDQSVTCPRIYVRQSLLPSVRSRFVAVTGAVSSDVLRRGPIAYGADRLVDQSVFENCGDAWLLPDGRQAGTAKLTFSTAPIGRIWVLNTQDGHAFDRAAKSISLSLLRGGVEVWKQQGAGVSAYPTWTTFDLPAGIVADTLVVSIDQSAGRGGGLNEIALQRTPVAAVQ